MFMAGTFAAAANLSQSALPDDLRVEPRQLHLTPCREEFRSDVLQVLVSAVQWVRGDNYRFPRIPHYTEVRTFVQEQSLWLEETWPTFNWTRSKGVHGGRDYGWFRGDVARYRHSRSRSRSRARNKRDKRVVKQEVEEILDEEQDREAKDEEELQEEWPDWEDENQQEGEVKEEAKDEEEQEEEPEARDEEELQVEQEEELEAKDEEEQVEVVEDEEDEEQPESEQSWAGAQEQQQQQRHEALVPWSSPVPWGWPSEALVPCVQGVPSWPSPLQLVAVDPAMQLVATASEQEAIVAVMKAGI